MHIDTKFFNHRWHMNAGIQLLGGTKKIALLSAGLLAVHPAWWYYSIRSLMPNVPFATFLLLGAWAWLSAEGQEKAWKKYVAYVCAGLGIGGALFIRPSEGIWMLGMGIGLLILRNKFPKDVWSYAACALGLVCVGGVAFMENSATYGSALTTGYTVDRAVWEVGGSIAQEDGPTFFEKGVTIVFPFGLHEYATLRHAWNYGVALYPWMTITGLIGVVWWIKERWRELVREKKNIIGGAFIVLALAHIITLYGSWIFFDNPDTSVITIGNSYVRYWIPVFILLTPASAYAVLALQNFLASKNIQGWVKGVVGAIPVVACIAMVLLSLHLVMTGDDGVLHTRSALATFVEKREKILEKTEEDAVVIVDRADKYLWPYRAVIVPLRSEKTYGIIPDLAQSVPLYYFGITLPEQDMKYLQEEILQNTVTVFPVVTVNEETLYAITPR